MTSTLNKLETLRKVRAVPLDMDGVLYVGDQPLPGVQELLAYLMPRAARLCVTNSEPYVADV